MCPRPFFVTGSKWGGVCSAFLSHWRIVPSSRRDFKGSFWKMFIYGGFYLSKARESWRLIDGCQFRTGMVQLQWSQFLARDQPLKNIPPVPTNQSRINFHYFFPQRQWYQSTYTSKLIPHWSLFSETPAKEMCVRRARLINIDSLI